MMQFGVCVLWVCNLGFFVFSIFVVAVKPLYTTTTSALCGRLRFGFGLGFGLLAVSGDCHKLLATSKKQG